MHAQTPKQEALHAIERLPDDVPLDEIVYRLYLLSEVQQGLDAGVPSPPTSSPARSKPGECAALVAAGAGGI